MRRWLKGCAVVVTTITASNCSSQPSVQPLEGHTTSKTGTFVVNPQFRRRPGGFKEGLANVQVGDDDAGKWGYIDKAGKFVINPQFDEADEFSEGLALVRIGDEKTGRWGYISR
jgi:hypothetical protein